MRVAIGTELLASTEAIERGKLRNASGAQRGNDGLVLCTFQPPRHEDPLACHRARAGYHAALPRWRTAAVHAFHPDATVSVISYTHTIYGSKPDITSARASSRGVGVRWANAGHTGPAVSRIAAKRASGRLVANSVACCWARTGRRSHVAGVVFRIIDPASRAIDRARHLVCQPSYSIAISRVGASWAERRVTLAIVCVPAGVGPLRT